MPASYTSGQPSNPRRHPTCWASSQWSHTASSTPCHGAWTSVPLSVHRVQMHDASNRDTHLYTPHNNSVHLTTTTYVRRSGRITNGMRCGRTTPQDSAFSSPTPAPNPPGVALPRRACVRINRLRTGVSTPACANGVWPPLRSVSVLQKNKPSTMLSSNPSISSWTAQPDGSGRWDNRMVAQHLRRDLARPSSGLRTGSKEELVEYRQRDAVRQKQLITKL